MGEIDKDAEIECLQNHIKKLEQEIGDVARVSIQRLRFDDMMQVFLEMQENHRKLWAVEMNHAKVARALCEQSAKQLRCRLDSINSRRSARDVDLSKMLDEVSRVRGVLQCAEVCCNVLQCAAVALTMYLV
jgi:hypothetical protein